MSLSNNEDDESCNSVNAWKVEQKLKMKTYFLQLYLFYILMVWAGIELICWIGIKKHYNVHYLKL